MSGSLSGGNTIGSGSDAIVLSLSEDSAAGQDAQFTVNVDGQQIGGRQTVTASHAGGQDETFTFLGNYGPGDHTVTVTFANNFLMPGESGDRNVYVDNVSYNGQTVSSSTTPIYESPLFPPNSDHNIWGNASFSVNDTTSVPGDASSTPSTTPGAVSIGSGSDTLVLNMAEDAYLGDAQFTVSVDGTQVGGTQTTTAHLAEGQQQEFDVHGNWGSGDHTVTIAYTNDQIGEFYAGTQLAVDTTDRNLYVMGMKLDGGSAAGSTPWELDSNGSHSFTVTAGSDQSGGASSSSSSSSSDSSTIVSSGSSGDSSSGTSDTATVTADSLSGSQSDGSSSGMSFIDPTTTEDTSSSSGSQSSDTSGTTAGSSDTTTTTVASSVGDSGQSTQDWTVPATSDSSGTTSTDSGSSTGWSGHWSGNWSGNNQWHGGWAHSHG